MDKFECLFENIVYLIQCEKENCKENKYIGENSKPMHERQSQHRGYVTINTKDATGRHFNRPGHTLANISMTVLGRVKIQILYTERKGRSTISKNSTLSIKE